MEVAGLALSAMAMVQLYTTCADAFSLIQSVRKAPHDFEITLIKLEVERVRFLTWGETVGISSVDPDRAGPQTGIDPRLYKQDIKKITCGVLMYMGELFQNTDVLKKRYGLRPDFTGREITDAESVQGRYILDSVFKRAYSSVHSTSGLETSRAGPSGSKRRRVRWAIADKDKFQEFITEIRGLNDSLMAMFPDIGTLSRDAMRRDVEESDEVESLQLLQEATEDGQTEISDTVSVRLITLGATAATISDFLEPSAEPVQWAPTPAIDREATPRPTEQEAELEEEKAQREALASLLLPSQGAHGEGPGAGLMAGPAFMAIQIAKEHRRTKIWNKHHDKSQTNQAGQTTEEMEKVTNAIEKEVGITGLGTPLLDELERLSVDLEKFVKERELGSLSVSVFSSSYSARTTTSTSLNGGYENGTRRRLGRNDTVRFPHEALSK
jgi:hypothetical protein